MLAKKNFIGLDLGHYAIKLVSLERIASGWKINKADAVMTPPGSIRDGLVAEPAQVAEAIKFLVKRSGIKANAAHVSVAGGSVMVRTAKVPQMTEATLRKSIKFEAGRYVPNSPEDSYIEFEILGNTDDGQMDVLIVAAPRQTVDSRVQACTMAGIEVESVDLETFAAYRSLVEANQGIDLSNDTMVLLDIGASTTHVSVVHQGRFAMTRTINHGGTNLTDALMRYFKLSFEDAEEGKLQLDVRQLLDDSKPTENPPLRVIQPQLDDLVREIRRSLNYYQSQHPDQGGGGQLTWMLVTGGAAQLVGLSEYLAAKLSLRVYSASIFDNPRFAYAGAPITGHGAELSVASGLAMRAYAKAA
ncbi:MAG: type IV pilus assembly protein PilM [Armatimonadetes bacterium]|nr:type IV pilus assembly protein PilM [Armatimonadota bacterium]